MLPEKKEAPSYSAFAEIYDDYMTNIPYDRWVNNIRNILTSYDIRKGLVAELGCGTGIVTRKLAMTGYDMIGIDSSEDMLSIAREVEEFNADSEDGDTDEENAGSGSYSPILYLNQDMRDMELYGTVGAFVSVCDSMNYLLDTAELTDVLKKVNLYLEKDGIFVFDMKTEYTYKNILGDTIQFESTDDSAIIWENHFDEDKKIHTYDLTMFIGYEVKDEFLYEKSRETHYQKAFSEDEVKNAIKDSGMELLKTIDADTLAEPTDTTERVYYVVKECYQKDKYYAS